jgi:large subunit ribosomal protein L16
MLFEMQGVEETVAKEAFELAAAKLPVKTAIIKRTIM